MGKEIKLDVKLRTAEEKVGDLKVQGFIPAVLYGADQKNQILKIKVQDFNKAYAVAGESTLIDLAVDGENTVKVIIKDIQKNPLKDSVVHVDFYAVDMKKPIEVEIPLHFVNKSKAVKELGGTLITNLETVTVKCLPDNLVESIDADLSLLEDFSNHIRVADLKLPEGMEVVNQETETIASVEKPRSERKQEAEDAGEEGAAGAEGAEEKSAEDGAAEEKPAE